jgi:hypothetical protein
MGETLNAEHVSVRTQFPTLLLPVQILPQMILSFVSFNAL